VGQEVASCAPGPDPDAAAIALASVGRGNFRRFAAGSGLRRFGR
jgi:hypothetical protein